MISAWSYKNQSIDVSKNGYTPICVMPIISGSQDTHHTTVMLENNTAIISDFNQWRDGSIYFATAIYVTYIKNS